MKILLFVPTASVDNDKPSPWFQELLDKAIEYSKNQAEKEIVFLVSGRWNNIKDKYNLTEAEVGKRYILSKLPNSDIQIEETAVETGGNFAFSKPFVDSIKPDKIVVFNSAIKTERTKYLSSKIFGSGYPLEFVFVEDSFSNNPRAAAKEPKALSMFKKLFDRIDNGDDEAAREILLNKTPFYNYDLMDNEKFFNEYWPGGFADFKEKRLSINNE